MKKTFQNYVAMALLALASTSPTACAQEQNTVTVRGKIVDAQTGKPPVGIVTINEKGNWEKDIVRGSNRHTIADKDGNFTIKIPKGASLSIKPSLVFQSLKYENIVKDEFLVIELQTREGIKINPNIKHRDIKVETVLIRGIVTDVQTKKPLDMITVSEKYVFNENGASRHTVTNEKGEYSFYIHSGSTISFEGMQYENKSIENINKDTLLNIGLNQKLAL